MKKFKIILVSIFMAILFLSDLLISQANWEPLKKSSSSGFIKIEAHTIFYFNKISFPKLLH
ncbi:hypothetical protein Cycma_3183 [Cyclobacterium marinum DSM 745]|uniref:Uncharacterized protein n=1 Tax=Cyclobacterium marinum (strain ATCC 25205 / DSM 745 / LMG 13164 / NCIMB 1802) TaxID=880070 RepID=G0J720_CYCMS|nr:hypothetical protein Cycma_3183 [Cyclobacterium marinum DSM 745]